MKKEQQGDYGKWTWNFYPENEWDNDLFETKKEAIKDGFEKAKKEKIKQFYIGKTKKPYVYPNISPELILDSATDTLYEEVGCDLAGAWLSSIPEKDIKELEKMLEDTYSDWLEKTDNYPQCYKIVNIIGIVTYCPETCDYLNITETEQQNLKINPDHKCNKYKQRLLHFEHHPELPRIEKCVLEAKEMITNGN